MVLTLKQQEKFLRRRDNVRNVILNTVKKEGGIIFGARAVNRQVPKHLEVHTEDYDILSRKDPKELAKKIEKKLDKKFGGNYYKVQPAMHPGTYKVVSIVSKKGTADVSKHPKGKIKVVRRNGVKFAHLDFQKKKIKQSLSDPQSKFRHDKDKFTRLRIKLAERKKNKPRRRKTGMQGLISRFPK